MRRGCWMLAAVLAASAGAQERIALHYAEYPLGKAPRGTELMQAGIFMKVPVGFHVTTWYTVHFGGSKRPAAGGTFDGKPALVVDAIGKGDLSSAEPYFETKLKGGAAFFGPFEMRWSVAGKPRMGQYRVVVQGNQTVQQTTAYSVKKDGEYKIVTSTKPVTIKALVLRPCGSLAGRGTILGRSAAVRVHDANCDGRYVDLLSSIEFDWGSGNQVVGVRDGVGLGKRFAKFRLDPTGTRLDIVPVSVQASAVRVPAGIVIGDAVGSSGRWLCEAEDGVLSVPARAELMAVGTTRARAGETWSILLYPVSPARDRRDTDARPDIAFEPLTIGLSMVKQGGTRTFSLNLLAPKSWRVASLTVGDKPPAPPVLELLAADGSVIDSPKFAYG